MAAISSVAKTNALRTTSNLIGSNPVDFLDVCNSVAEEASRPSLVLSIACEKGM